MVRVTIFLWSQPCCLFKEPVKIGHIRKTHVHGHSQHVLLSLCQSPCRESQPVIVQIADEGHTHMIFEKFHEMRLAETGKFRHLFDALGLSVIDFDSPENAFHFIQGFFPALLSQSRLHPGKHKEKELEEPALHRQRIAPGALL